MITRLEATRYRCFERLAIDVGPFQVLVGPNGSGKTTLLDLPVLLGELLREFQATHKKIVVAQDCTFEGAPGQAVPGLPN